MTSQTTTPHDLIELDLPARPAGFWDDAEVVHTYTRQQALEDGFLVDVSEMAREAGFRFPVAVTRELWEIIENDFHPGQGQSYAGRMWDILTVLRADARRTDSDRINFAVIMKRKSTRRRYLFLRAIVSGGDNGEPVITIEQRQ